MQLLLRLVDALLYAATCAVDGRAEDGGREVRGEAAHAQPARVASGGGGAREVARHRPLRAQAAVVTGQCLCLRATAAGGCRYKTNQQFYMHVLSGFEEMF